MEDRNRDEPSKNIFYIVTSGRVTNVIHLFVLVFTVSILYISFSGDVVFFTWHPILMGVGVSIILFKNDIFP